MKILQINTERGWRGGERQTLYTLQGLRELEIDVELLCRRGESLSRRARDLGIPVHMVSGTLQALAFLAFRAKRFDVLHAQTARAQGLAVLTKAAHRRPVVYTRRVDFKPSGLMARWKYKRTDKVVAISSAIRDILLEFGSFSAEIIPSVVREEKIPQGMREKLIHEYGLQGKHVIGTTAALVPHKDPFTMVRAIERLYQIRGEDFLFLHFGSGPLEKEITELLRSRKMETCYRLMGFHEDILPWFQIFDIFTMSSQEEGLGSSVLDAFMYEVPVVATAAGGLRELVGDRGLLCEIGDHDCLAQSMHSLLSNAEKRKMLGSAGREYARHSHSLINGARQYHEIFNSMQR